MPKFDGKLFWKAILSICLAVLGDSVMRELDLLQFGSSIVRAAYFIFALIISGSIVQFSWMNIKRFLAWKKSPKPQNIHLSCLSLANNEICLKIKNLEFRKPQVIISKVEIGISDQKNWLAITYSNSTLKFLKSVVLSFIRLNPKENTFSVIYPDNEILQEFGVGVYKFDVVIHYGYSSPREGLLNRYCVFVEFGGGMPKVLSLSSSAT